MSIPDGYVDPTDPLQIREVIAEVLGVDGVTGIFDLLGRLPNAQLREGTSGGFRRRAQLPSVWLSDEHQFTLVGSPGTLEHSHIVRGVALQHERLSAHDLADLLAHLIPRYITETGHSIDAAAALTAARDLARHA